MGLLSYIEPVGAALNLAKSILRPRPAPSAPPQRLEVDSGAFQAALAKQLRAADEKAQATLKQFDANGDGYLTRAELAVSEDGFRRLDANLDGRLDSAELVRAYAQGQESLR